MGWVAAETEKLIVPIIEQMEGGAMRQTRIDSFMRYEDGIKFAKVQSKRLRQVLGLSSKDAQQSRRKTTSRSGSQTESEDVTQNRFSEEEEEDFYDEPDEEAIAAMDASIMAMHNGPHEINEPKPKKKRYNGKRTRSLVTLSSASASTVAIANSSKSDEVGSSDASGPSMPVARQNLPKKAPPSYQKQSSTILEEEKESSAESLGGTKSNSTYEVINPSMI